MANKLGIADEKKKKIEEMGAINTHDSSDDNTPV